MADIPHLSEIDTLMLDMDGTLLDLRFDNHFWVDHLPGRYGDIHDVAAHDANLHVSSSLASADGTMNWYCIDHWSKHFRLDIMALKQEVRDLIRFREGSQLFLERLKDLSHLKVVLVTDAHPAVLALKQEVLDIRQYVSAVFCSHDYGVPKRDHKFWPRLQQDLGHNPARTMMIDDSEHVLDQSAAAGIAYQLCIDQPDSGRQRDHQHGYPLINNLATLLQVAS